MFRMRNQICLFLLQWTSPQSHFHWDTKTRPSYHCSPCWSCTPTGTQSNWLLIVDKKNLEQRNTFPVRNTRELLGRTRSWRCRWRWRWFLLQTAVGAASASARQCGLTTKIIFENCARAKDWCLFCKKLFLRHLKMTSSMAMSLWPVTSTVAETIIT